VKLLPVEGPVLVRTVADWLARTENYQWLDFGHGRRVLSAEWLAIAARRPSEVLRVYTARDGDTPIGVVALTEVDRSFRTARIWVVAGNKSFAARGLATVAARRLLAFGFRELGLRAIHTWIVDGNPSLRIVRRLGFSLIGRQRACHVIDGQMRDRFWFDLLDSEFRDD
jgi:RimJ/RimL family protein N-acetyltransferase